MNSNFTVRVARLLALAVLIGVSAPQITHAYTSARGKFVLTTPARWGEVNLPAGAYSYSLESSGSQTFILISDASGRSIGMVLPQTAAPKPHSLETTIELASDSRGPYISSITIADLGLEYTFVRPSGKTEWAAKGASPSAQVAAYSAAK